MLVSPVSTLVIQSDGRTFELVYHQGLQVCFHLSFSASGTAVTQKHCQSGRTNENQIMCFSKHFRKFGKAHLTRKIAWQRIQIQVARVEITFWLSVNTNISILSSSPRPKDLFVKCCQWMYSQPLFTVDKNLPSVILPALTIVGFQPAAKWLMQESFGGYTSRDDNFPPTKTFAALLSTAISGLGGNNPSSDCFSSFSDLLKKKIFLATPLLPVRQASYLPFLLFQNQYK